MNIVTTTFRPFNEFLTSLYPLDGPGAAVLVQKDGQLCAAELHGRYKKPEILPRVKP